MKTFASSGAGIVVHTRPENLAQVEQYLKNKVFS
jgi:hypothetical protein